MGKTPKSTALTPGKAPDAPQDRKLRGETVPKSPKGHFQKGNPGKPKGAKAKINRDIKEVIQRIVNYVGDPERMPIILAQVAAKKPDVLLSILAKFAPKSLELSNPDGSLAPKRVVFEIVAKNQETK